jgi:formylglycine-generating enzyme required for sulfatase activity
VNIETVRVGNPGNRPDRNGYGRVDASYSIGKYEITISQYCAFLNAVAASDPYRLYNPGLMTNPLNGGITRSGSDGSYSYTPIAGTEAFPITGVSWFDAARFANWLANGQPVGACNAQTTEDGAYTLAGRLSGPSAARNSINPNTGQPPSFALPTENEWYKAAYHNPRLRNGRGGYFTYATQSLTTPGNQLGSKRNQVNYILDRNGFYAVTQEPFAHPQQNYLSAVGSLSSSVGPYGTFDQNGNVWELVGNDNPSQPFVHSRGGAWTSLAALLQSNYRIGSSTDAEAVNAGFRIVMPPPSSAATGVPRRTSAATARAVAPTSEPSAISTGHPSTGQQPSRADASVQLTFLAVGDADNAPDPLTGFGAVAQAFQISSTVVTIGQYTAFLNAVARRDPHRLFHRAMQSDLNIAGIRRRGRAGRYRYEVIDNGGDSADRPITYVSWFDAARFANWMANGQPVGKQSRATTEDGAYTLRRSGITAPARNRINPNTGEAPSFFIPTENEWYKAAYFNPTLNDNSGGYSLYATQSNSAPSNSPSMGGSNEANLANGFVFYTSQSNVYDPITNYLTDVGHFVNSRSFYGTYDQAGLVYEWNDLNGERSREKGLRGGYWFSAGQSAMATTFSLATPDRESSDAGFRLAAPEPLA